MAFGFRPFRSCPATEDMHAATTSLVITRPLLLGVSVTLRSANKLWSEVPIWQVLYVFYPNPRSGANPKEADRSPQNQIVLRHSLLEERYSLPKGDAGANTPP